MILGLKYVNFIFLVYKYREFVYICPFQKHNLILN